MKLKEIKRSDLVIGQHYSDIPFFNERAAVLEFVKRVDNLIRFKHISGPNPYMTTLDDLICFYANSDNPFYELPKNEENDN